MKSRYKVTLTIKGVVHEITPDCFKNWDDVVCTYKRSDFSGVVRGFTSKFEFVGDAYDLMLAEYLSDRYTADVKVSVWTLNNEWTYTKRFECPLDFSSVLIENGTFAISAIDNSVAAVIKANKGTKYEMLVGSDILTDGLFHFDRVPMTESVTYGLTDGESEDDTGAIRVTLNSSDGNVIWLGSTSNEISIGGHVYWNDDQEGEEDSYMIEAHKAVSVKLESSIVIDACYGSGSPQALTVQQLNSNGDVIDATGVLCHIGYKEYTDVGAYANINALRNDYPEHDGAPASGEKWIATIDGIVWVYKYNGSQSVWQNTYQTREESSILRLVYDIDKTFEMGVGDKLRAVVVWNSGTTASSRILSSAIRLTWQALGDMCDIPAFKPVTVLDAILRKMCAGNTNAVAKISNHDSRLASTVLMAAEDVRAIPDPKLYSSFNDFCDWMEAVFGYTYYLGQSWESRLTGTTQSFGGMTSAYPQSTGSLPSQFSSSDIRYSSDLGKFILCKNGYWHTWPGSEEYNDPEYGGPLTDRLFYDGSKYYYFIFNDDGSINPTPIEYLADISDKELPFHEVVFVHRSELFPESIVTKTIADAINVRHSVNSSAIYSTVEIGYDKKDYDSINGRDEFNFSNTYSTGCNVSTKKLSLISKYRADCYGIEFAAQKRGKDTTDSDSDNDVFFAHVIASGRNFNPDRTIPVAGALSNAVFNAAFSPIHCVRANAGYIGIQADVLTLTFASSKGNSDIVIGGYPMSGNITLDTPLLTAGEVEFETDDTDIPDTGDLIMINKDGLSYIGFISEVEERFIREEAIKYKLLLKSIEPC